MLGTWLSVRTKFGPNADQAQLGDLVDAFGADKFNTENPVPDRFLMSFIGIDIPVSILTTIDPLKVNNLCTTPAVNYLTDPPTQSRIIRCQVVYASLPQAARDELVSQRWTIVDWDDIKDIFTITRMPDT